jgi:hypothetical protein
MKITRTVLSKLIKEELNKVMNEVDYLQPYGSGSHLFKKAEMEPLYDSLMGRVKQALAPYLAKPGSGPYRRAMKHMKAIQAGLAANRGKDLPSQIVIQAGEDMFAYGDPSPMDEEIMNVLQDEVTDPLTNEEDKFAYEEGSSDDPNYDPSQDEEEDFDSMNDDDEAVQRTIAIAAAYGMPIPELQKLRDALKSKR